jgi:hypothetical protein
MSPQFSRPVVITSHDAEAFQGAAGEGNKEDGYLEKIIKYIPAEVVAAYLSLSGSLVSLPLQDKHKASGLWILSGIMLVSTPFYWLLSSRTKRLTTISRIYQVSFAMVAFAIWVLALGGPFEACCEATITNGVIVNGWWVPGWGAIAIGLVTFLSPMIEKLFFGLYKFFK